MQMRFPVRMSVATGFTIMAAGDAAVQLRGNGKWDPHRTAVTSTFNGATSPGVLYWGRILDSRWPGFAPSAALSKALVNQICIAPWHTMFFVVWTTCLGSLLYGGGAASAEHRVTELGTTLSDKMQHTLPGLVVSSTFFWLPANAVNFMLVPLHFRVAYMSVCGAVWGAYTSYVAYQE